jgi:hypothetical protein
LDGDFTVEQRNIHFGMALDGVNPFSNQSLSHSTWPVLLVNYNLPAWLVTKPFFHNVGIANSWKGECDIREH